jgi:hypothetical protein
LRLKNFRLAVFALGKSGISEVEDKERRALIEKELCIVLSARRAELRDADRPRLPPEEEEKEKEERIFASMR